ncbi:ubiquinone/menaquinone biosynthesis C-methylase UbiE [Rossellomorea marisflavi]
MKFLNWLKTILEDQHQRPSGLLGLYIGEKMVVQHEPETRWTLDLLNLNEEESVLELGCGAGYALKLLAKRSSVKEVVGMDLSKSIIGSAKRRNKDEIKRGKVKLVQGDVKDLPFEDQLFTRIMSIHSVYFWGELPRTIREMYRVLKPGGTIVITLCNGTSEEIWSGVNKMIDDQLLPLMKENSLKNVLLKTGPRSRGYQTVAICAEK